MQSPRPTMKNTLQTRILVLLLVYAGHAMPHSASANEVPLESPVFLPEHRIKLQLAAPQAQAVQLRGIERVPLPLQKDDKGTWTITIGPLPQGIYGYSFIVDGRAIIDPLNPKTKPELRPETSVLEVVTGQPFIYQWQRVPHGTVRLHEYESEPLKRLRRIRVYTPPGYDRETAGRFPVLYLAHGTGDTEATWTEFGRAHVIMDNLLAQKKVVPMLVVMMDGHADLHDEEGIDARNLDGFEADLLQSVVPMVDHEYRTLDDRDHRAICGLSMGGIQSLSTGLRHSDRFAWIGGMSAWVPQAETRCAAALSDPGLNGKLRLLWNQMGRDDPYMKDYMEFEGVLAQHNIKRSFKITKGDHSWPVWRDYLAEFAPLLFH
jgi:enterochelin esterase-like enzyme